MPTIQGRAQPLKGADDDGSVASDSAEASDLNDEEDSESSFEDDVDEDLTENISSVSFGALEKAQQALGKRKRPGSESATQHSSVLDGLRQKLRQAREGSEEPGNKERRREHARSSKHAPTEMSSRKAVSRKRDVIAIAKRNFRDPRFESLSGRVDQETLRRNYAFLEDYQKDEMKELKDAIKKTRDEESKEKLKRELLSMESRQKAQLSKDKHQEIIRKHRAQEKELIKQGKKPFYLKKSEQKKLALVEQYNSLKEKGKGTGKQIERAMERKRKKKAAKERKKMPFTRRAKE